MDSMNVLSENLKLSGARSENSENLDFDERIWNCMTSKVFLACYFENFKLEEENNGDVIRSKPADKKELTCSTEEYQQSVLILMENTWSEQLCKCFGCFKMYQDQNVEFLFSFNNIESLPTELLLKIFKQLTPSDRRVASECCKRFLDIWLCDDFINDRRLVFACCVLDPKLEPLSTFLKSSRIYRTLAFGYGNVIVREASEFIAKFGQIITTIEIIGSSCRLTSVTSFINFITSNLSQFPNLKTMNMKTESVHPSGIRQSINVSNVPRNLDLLVFSDNLSAPNDFIDKLSSCYLDTTSESFRVELNFPILAQSILKLTESQRNKVQSVSLSLTDSCEFKLPRFKNLKCLSLYFDEECFYGTEEILESLEKQLPALKDLSISIEDRLPHKNWTCLKTLEVRNLPNDEISRLSIFENLQELTLQTNDRCFFVHEAFLNNNLKTLNLNDTRTESCFICFQTMTKSFPELVNFISTLNLTNNHLIELATNTPKLKFLQIACVDPSPSLNLLPNLYKLNLYLTVEANLNESWPFMLHLHTFRIELRSVDYETVKIFEKMQGLENLYINYSDINGDPVLLFEMIAKSLKRLKRIEFNNSQIKPEDFTEIVDALAINCKYLKHIKVFNKKLEHEVLEQLLQKHSSLRIINHVWQHLATVIRPIKNARK